MRNSSHAPMPAASAMSTANHRPPSHTMKIRTGSAIAAVRIRLAIITFNCLAAHAGVLVDSCDRITGEEALPFHSHGAIRLI